MIVVGWSSWTKILAAGRYHSREGGGRNQRIIWREGDGETAEEIPECDSVLFVVVFFLFYFFFEVDRIVMLIWLRMRKRDSETSGIVKY